MVNKKYTGEETLTPFGESRRKFIANTTLMIWAFYNPINNDAHAEADARADDWAFLKRNENYPSTTISWEDIERKYIPLGKPTELVKGSKEFVEKAKGVEGILKEEINVRGFDTNGRYQLALEINKFAVPDDIAYSQSVLHYAQKAMEFMQNHPQLKDFQIPSIDWTVLREGDDYKKNPYGKGLIGRAYYEVLRINYVNTKHILQRFMIGESRLYIRSETFFDCVKTGKNWYVFLTTSTPAGIIISPYSETMHILTGNTTCQYAEQAGEDEAITASEIISEVVAHKLAEEGSGKFNLPNGGMLVKESLKILPTKDGRYRYIPQGLELEKNYGVDGILKMYMDNPAKFMKEIKSIK